MARIIAVDGGDELRLICPNCETTWNTLCVPSECPECGALVTIRILKSPSDSSNQHDADKQAHGDADQQR
jgi:hypothetical protein